jgi:hypothetical protein
LAAEKTAREQAAAAAAREEALARLASEPTKIKTNLVDGYFIWERNEHLTLRVCSVCCFFSVFGFLLVLFKLSSRRLNRCLLGIFPGGTSAQDVAQKDGRGNGAAFLQKSRNARDDVG